MDFRSPITVGGVPITLVGHTHAFSELSGRPTTLSSYGITDAEPFLGFGTSGQVLTSTGAGLRIWQSPTVPWSGVTGRPTTLSGYGITDAASASALSVHTGNTNNPHSVTAAQVGALALTGGSLSGLLVTAGNSGSGMATATGQLGSIQVRGDGTNAAFVSFHRPGSWALYLGLDTDNKLKVGGWSLGANAFEILHAGNLTNYVPWTSTARPGPTRLYRRDNDSGYSLQTTWNGTHWVLQGYTSSDAYHAGVRVAYADTAAALAVGINLDVGEVYTEGWFRTSTALNGLYSQNYGNHFYAHGYQGYTITANTGYYPQLAFRTGHQGTMRGYVYSDGSGFGLLNNLGQWMLYAAANSQHVVLPGGINAGGQSHIASGSGNTLYLYANGATAGRVYYYQNGSNRVTQYWDSSVMNFYAQAVGVNLLILKHDNGCVGIRKDNPSYMLEIGADSAGKPGSSTWSVTSDMRSKDEASIRPFTAGLEALRALPSPIYYRYNGLNGLPNDREYVGYVAQDLQAANPDMVTVNEAGLLTNNYHDLQFIYQNALLELDALVLALLRRVKELENR